MFTRIDHIEIVPSNLDRTIEFYTEVLGFNLQSRRKVDAPDSPMQETAFIELNDIQRAVAGGLPEDGAGCGGYGQTYGTP